MDTVYRAFYSYFKEQLPGYLRSLPLPNKLGGFAYLSREQWLDLLPFALFLVFVFILLLSPFINFCSRSAKKVSRRINYKQQMKEKKVATPMDIEDLGDKTALCRCWKSAKFPYCDGTHNKHNLETGDNVGPAVLKRRRDPKPTETTISEDSEEKKSVEETSELQQTSTEQ